LNVNVLQAEGENTVVSKWQGKTSIYTVDKSIPPGFGTYIAEVERPGYIRGGIIYLSDYVENPAWVYFDIIRYNVVIDSLTLQQIIDYHINHDGDWFVYLDEYDSTNKRAYLKFSSYIGDECGLQILINLADDATSSMYIFARALINYRSAY